jgi:hypothetical protein
LDNDFAPEALDSHILHVLSDHALIVLTTAVSMLLHALVLGAQAKTLSLTSMKNQLVGQLVKHVIAVGGQLVLVKLLDALMPLEFGSRILLVADLAHDLDLWAISLDVVIELSPRHVLILLPIADVASELWTVELSMGLELAKSLPDYLGSLVGVASVRELAEVNAVLEHLVNWLHEVTTSLAARAAGIVVWVHALVLNHHFVGSSSISAWRHPLHMLSEPWINQAPLLIIDALIVELNIGISTLDLNLAIFTEELVAIFTLEGLVWELEADGTLDLLNHLSL